jgi:hypothetical protein
MSKQQARYLVKRRELDLWSQVLTEDNLHRRSLVDQVRISIFCGMDESLIKRE